MRMPMKNASRERRKAERVALSAQLERLETDLALRRSAVINATVWRARVHDELRKRRLAESTNHQLHEALRRQETTLGTLIQSLNEGPAKPKAVPLTVPSSRLHDAHGRRFAMLLEDVDRAFHTDLPRVFRSPGRPASDQFTTRLVKAQQEMVLEARRSITVACALPRCGEALWTASEQVARATHRNAWVSRPSPDVVLMRLHASATHGGGENERATRWAATSSLVEKRFCMGDRMAIVWRAVTSIDNRAALADVYVEETGWTLVTEDKEQGNDEWEESVRVADCVQTVPRSTRLAEDAAEGELPSSLKKGEDEDVGTYVRQFTRHVMDATTAHLDAIRDRMENLLIDECMRMVEP